MGVTLHDVARLAGVSIKTVSNVVNDHPQLRPDTREKVLAAIRELGYQPNLSARSLKLGRSGAIGLVLPELSLSYFGELADAVMARAAERGLVVLIEQTGAEREREIAALSSPRIRQTDGLIFSPMGMGPDDAQHLPVDYPLVVLGEQILVGRKDHVTMRNVDAARAATAHLIGRGRRRIAVIGAHEGESVGPAALRVRGYREALTAAGIEPDPRLMVTSTVWHRANGAACMQELLDRGVPFDAVFGLNDTLALGALRVLLTSGVSVPEDVAVMGFDNLDETRFSVPSLTTVEPGRAEIARRAVDTLVERIEQRGAAAAGPQELSVGFTIIERESTAIAGSPS